MKDPRLTPPVTNLVDRTMNVVILEDDYFLAGMLKSMINGMDGYQCEHTFANPLLFLESDVKPDILLLDVMMPEMNGLDAIEPILEKCPDCAVIMNTIKDDSETIFTALKRGALGYVDKQSLEVDFEEVLRTVSSGGAYMTPKIARIVFNSFQRPQSKFENLTDREKDVCMAILDGLSYKMIADRFNISINTVRMNVKNIYRKLKINSKGELFSLSRGKH